MDKRMAPDSVDGESYIRSEAGTLDEWLKRLNWRWLSFAMQNPAARPLGACHSRGRRTGAQAQYRTAYVIGPAVAADGHGVAAPVVAAVNRQPAHAHVAKAHLLQVTGHRP
jgi:hypothetical protein